MGNIRQNKTKYIIFLLVGISFLATAGIFIRRSSLAPINIGLWRVIFALPFLFILAFKDFKKMNVKDIPFIFLSGVFLAGDLIFFNYAMLHTSLANTNLLTNLTAFIIVPVSFFLFKEKIPKFYLVGLFIAVFGIVILVTGKAEPTKSNYIGDLSAACACIFYSSFSISVYKLRDKVPGTIIMFFGAFGTIAALFIAALFTEGIMIPTTPGDIICSLMLALCVQVIGHTLVAHCQGFLSINLASAIKLLQPVIAAIYSVIIFREVLSIKEIVGIVIVIFGVYICKKQYSK